MIPVAVPTEPNGGSPFVCPECRLGTAQLRPVYYCAWLDGLFLSVPNFPAWVCDVCGFREYDGTALHELEAVVYARQRPRDLRPPRLGPAEAADLHSERQ